VLAADSAAATRYHAPADRPGHLLCNPPSPRCPAPGRYAITPGGQHLLRAAARPDGRTGPRHFAPSSAMHRPRLAGVAVWGWVDVCGSHSSPLDADRDWWQTLEHLSPWRGIWCGIQLNTMSAHGIPSELSVSCERSRRPVRERSRKAWKRSPGEVPGTLLPSLRGIRISRKDRGPGCGRRRPGGLHDMRYPLRHRLNRPLTNPGPAACRGIRCPGTYFNQAILTSPSCRARYNRSGADTPSSPSPVRSTVRAASASHSRAAASAPSRGADRPPNASAGRPSAQSSHAPATLSR
jgi:hypothetical protein